MKVVIWSTKSGYFGIFENWIFSHYFGNIESKRTANIQIRANGSLVQKNQKYKLVLKVN